MAGSDRVSYITDRETVADEHRDHFDSIEASRGSVRGPFAILMHSPELAGRTAHLGSYIRFEGEIPDVEREIAILTTARAFDCAYEWAGHVPIAEDVGVREEVLEVIAEETSTDGLDENERIVIEYARELHDDRRISAETFEAALDRFGVSGVVELTATCGYYAMNACTLNAFEVYPDEDRPALP